MKHQTRATSTSPRGGRRLATGRVQDWIDSVINPILEGLEFEARYLPDGPWELHANQKVLERLHPLRAHVLHRYLDNLDDFLDVRSEFKARFKKHDDAVAVLQDSVARTFDSLLVRQPTGPGIEPTDWRYVLSYVAANFDELPSHFGLAERYDSNAELRRSLRAVAHDGIEQSRRHGQELATISTELREKLRETRRVLANRYGARIVPVESAVG